MVSTSGNAAVAAAGSANNLVAEATSRTAGEAVLCHHCGTPCPGLSFTRGDKHFCCNGCLTVYELLAENGLTQFYELGEQPGLRIGEAAARDRFKFLDEPAMLDRLLDYADAKQAQVTFRVPSIHCVACVWLLENLFRLKPGIGNSRVNFPRKEVAISYDPSQLKLSEVVALLASMGYEPELNLSNAEPSRKNVVSRKLWLQVGVAGFAFGNVMLASLPSYLGLEAGASIQRFLGYVSLALAIPVLLFSASGYWQSALLAIRQRVLTIELPIVVGLVALFGQSAFEILSGRGEGYLDSLTGLVFFLLCGRVFQEKTYDRLSFDLDYQSFFPISVVRKSGGREETVSLSSVEVGDHLILRHGELVPADACLVSGEGLVDYSFVTGESEPVTKTAGDHLYAGGRQVGGAIEVETHKPVSQSHLTSLWSNEAFRKHDPDALNNVTNLVSRYFVAVVAFIALGTLLTWLVIEPTQAVTAFTAVLIVACPCALALSAPFALGTAQRLLGRFGVFLKRAEVVEAMARVDAVVLDKTGTLTQRGSGPVEFQGTRLTPEERSAVVALARNSHHPHSARISCALGGTEPSPKVARFQELMGRGVSGQIAGTFVQLGSANFLRDSGVEGLQPGAADSASVHLAVDGHYRGRFLFGNELRPRAEEMTGALSDRYELALLSGDNERERPRFERILGPRTEMHFDQEPLSKLNFVRRMQERGRHVLMMGDGLNDAGALKQSDVGVAVVENIGSFSPASDVILGADKVGELDRVLHFSGRTIKVVWASFAISALYNVAGISVAALGYLSPLVSAILMPVSSVSVVVFAVTATHLVAKFSGVKPNPAGARP